VKTKTTTKPAKKTQAGKPAKAKRKPRTQNRLARARRLPRAAATDTSDASTTSAPRGTSKKATIEALVRRTEGAAITELMAATGWQEHSVRAALTGLRKAGHAISRERDDGGASRYRITQGI